MDTLADTAQLTWVAMDGTKVLLRQIQPTDFDLERDFVNGLSRSTGYMRLMSARYPSDEEIRRWTNFDRQYEEALIATVSAGGFERQVGVARYAAKPDGNGAECAIVVTDAWQRKGLGTQLLAGLIDLARRSGVKRLFGTTLSENKSMIGLGLRRGFSVSRDPKSAVITELSIDLGSDVSAVGRRDRGT